MLTLRQDGAFASLAIAMAAALHVWLLWVLFQQRVEMVRIPPPQIIMVLPPKVLPKPNPVPVVKKVITPKPVVVRKPLVVPHVIRRITPHSAARPTAPPPVMHFNAAPLLAGLGLDIGTPAGGNGQPGEVDAFDDAVKARIQAAKTYPPGLAPVAGLKFWNECVVSYRVTVDRSGALLDYKIYGCGNPFLDSAAAAALLNAQPYPVPPNFGGTRYDVFGSLIFKQRKGAAP